MLNFLLAHPNTRIGPREVVVYPLPRLVSNKSLILELVRAQIKDPRYDVNATDLRTAAPVWDAAINDEDLDVLRLLLLHPDFRLHRTPAEILFQCVYMDKPGVVRFLLEEFGDLFHVEDVNENDANATPEMQAVLNEFRNVKRARK
jgi:hypothetical protein